MKLADCIKYCILQMEDFDDYEEYRPTADPVDKPLPVIKPKDLIPQMNSDPFVRATDIVSVNEGGWCNVRGDKGGETIFGVARNYHKKWSGWKIVDEVADRLGRGTKEFKDEVNNDIHLHELATNYFKTIFWLPANCDKMHEVIAIITYDMNINSGVSIGQRTLQRTLNAIGVSCTVDGKVGPLTLKALEDIIAKDGIEKVATAFLKKRYEFYQAIINRKKSQKKFWNGWVNRLKYLATELINNVPEFLVY